MSGGASIPDRVREIKQRLALSVVIGGAVKLTKRGREYVAPCPFHREQTPSFTVSDEKGFYHCFGCGAHGDAIKFVMEHTGHGFDKALAMLEGDAGMAAQSATVREGLKKQERTGNTVDRFEAACLVLEEARPARGTLVENWFRARGLDPGATGALDMIQFHPRCPAHLWKAWQKPGDVRRTAPAMIAPILRIHGGPGDRAINLAGVHITFLSGDGRSKAYFEPWQDRETGKLVSLPDRVMWGGVAGGAVLLPGRPLDDGADLPRAILGLLDAPGLCVVGEGIESTLSFTRRHQDVRLACATLSLGNMQGNARRVGKRDAVPLWQLSGDTAREGRPFLFEKAGRVAIGVDADMKPTQPIWVQERKGEFPVQRALNGLERSAYCAALALWWWRWAGTERVDVSRPPAGHDFNDLDQGVGNDRPHTHG